jgi:hypothetical protein
MTTMADPGIRSLGALAIVIGLLVALLNKEVELLAVLAVATGFGVRVEAALRVAGRRREDAEAPRDKL